MNPYDDLPENSFWRLAVANKSMFDISNLWKPKWQIKKNHKIVTYGSCFAQHIGRALDQRGFNWLRTESPPFGLSHPSQKDFNYNIFSSRTGNIYTTSLLNQWIKWSLGEKKFLKRFGRVRDDTLIPSGLMSSQKVSCQLKK